MNVVFTNLGCGDNVRKRRVVNFFYQGKKQLFCWLDSSKVNTAGLQIFLDE